EPRRRARLSGLRRLVRRPAHLHRRRRSGRDSLQAAAYRRATRLEAATAVERTDALVWIACVRARRRLGRRPLATLEHQRQLLRDALAIVARRPRRLALAPRLAATRLRR